LADAKLAAEEQASTQTMWMQEKNELLEAAVALETNHQAAITWLEGQLKNHQSSLAWAEGELKRQQAYLALLEGQLKESQNALVQAQSQINFDALSLAQLKHAIALTEDAKLSAEQEISSLKNSRSWRYTRFLRRTS
jgi:chromosome segregation ATPase